MACAMYVRVQLKTSYYIASPLPPNGRNQPVHTGAATIYCTPIKKKITFFSYIKKFKGIGCKVIYD